jgi:flavin reductase (DIM6/NTAB) family NADH-FMN oxidoreductase RutF
MKRSLGARALVFPTPVWVIGTYDKEGKPNVMTAAWGGICSSGPPCVYVSVRKARATFENLMARQAFTVNVPSESQVREADFFGLVSGKKTDKFAEAGLTPVRGDRVDAPFVKEFSLVLECKVIQTVDLGVHTQFIGEVLDVKADEAVLGADGLPDIKKVNPMVYTPESRLYYGIGGCLGKAYTVGKGIDSGKKE